MDIDKPLDEVSLLSHASSQKKTDGLVASRNSHL
jgi:hypothetical protein